MGIDTMAKTKESGLESELERSYCNICQSTDIKITRVIKVECRKCGKTRLITARLR